MKPFWKDVLFSCLMGLVLPAMVLRVGILFFDRDMAPEEPTVAQVIQEKPKQMLDVLTDEDVVRMELEEYLTGVVLAEMPAAFEAEALKAQAVVARTYTMRAHNGKSKHENASVCTNSSCCQGYISPHDYQIGGGTLESVEKIREAVSDTEGYVLSYGGELIEATYFSCSGGTTEDAVAVWGTDVPYLKSVESPGEEHATHYTDTAVFAADEFRAALSKDLVGQPEDWFGEISYTSGGGVESIEICGKRYRGTELRMLLGLRSTAFSISTDGELITVTTRGFGHRVGMSQYGADAMAAAGSDFREILSHYYPGTTLEQLED